MRKIVFLFAITLLLNQHLEAGNTLITNTDKSGYNITVNTKQLSGKYLYLSRRADGQWVKIDSSALENKDKVVFSGKIQTPEMLYLKIDENRSVVPFFAENSNIEIEPNFINPDDSKITGSSVHNELVSFQDLFKEIDRKNQELYNDYRSAKSENNEDEVNKIVAKANELEETRKKITMNYISENSDSHITPYIIRNNLFYTLNLEELKELVSDLDENLDNSPYTLDLRNKINTLEKVSIGKKYIDFELPTPDGGKMSLSDVVGAKVLLIDFWASWCGPCRRENPDVVALYNDFHEKGFDIIGVSLDNSEENWKKAIEDDGLVWHHVSDLKGWNSKAGKMYGVSSIPHTILLDENGVIIEKNLRGEALRDKVKEILD